MPGLLRTKNSGKRASRAGYTFVELAVVVLIIGILAAAVAPNYADNLFRFRVEAAAKRIAADLRYARQFAIDEGKPQSVTFTLASATYAMSTATDPNHPSETYIVNLSETAYPVSLTAASFNGSPVVGFDYHGMPTSGGTVTIAAGGFTKTIDLNAGSGLPTIQ